MSKPKVLARGVEYYDDTDTLLLIRCPKCCKENYADVLNKQLVKMENVETKTDLVELKKMIEAHVRWTGSQKGREILERFDEYKSHFKKIIPSD